jgi:hypothetical protein
MSTIKHQDNFGTNLTAGTSAGALTSPINLIPTVAAPFYIAFDATNINGHYEVRQITSKTATDVIHAATTYDHTTAEEVRMVVPAVEFDNFMATPGTDGVYPLNLSEGQMINGRILPSVASNNLTVALKTLAGTDPSATDPVYVMIGGVVRSITSALSITEAAGNNWRNLGSAELATKETDLFVYLGYSTISSSVKINYTRIPYGTVAGDFNGTVTNEKYCGLNYPGESNATDPCVVIGRFAATLSAGAGYTWSVPTFTATNLIQRPVYETRWLSSVGTLVNASGVSLLTTNFNYKLIGSKIHATFYSTFTQTGTSANLGITAPFTSATFVSGYIGVGNLYRTTTPRGHCALNIQSAGSIIYVLVATGGSNESWVNSAGYSFIGQVVYEI